MRLRNRGVIPKGWLTTRQAAARLGVCPQRVLQMREVGRLRGEQLWRNYRPLRGWYFLEGDVEALKADPLYQEVRERYLTANSPEREEEREAERLKKLAEWTLHVNGWDDPWHTFTYQAAPEGEW
jgi:hypothetical protein